MSFAAASAADYFGGMTGEYDSLIRRAVPRYDEMIERLAGFLPPDAARVLELGCGTGNLSLRLARLYPRAELTYVDASAEMVELTGARLRALDPAFAARARPARLRFEELEAGGEPFDLVVSSISLHHVADKGALYRTVFARLAPGGAFRWADQMRGGTPDHHRRIWERWLEFCRLPGNCSEDEIRSLLDHAEAHDHYTPLAEHFHLLASAGFRSVDCVWRDGMWGVVTADRPAA